MLPPVVNQDLQNYWIKWLNVVAGWAIVGELPRHIPVGLNGLSFFMASRVKGFASRGVAARQKRMFYVYVLHSEADHGLYIGYTSNLRRRISEHNAGELFATSFRGPWKLAYYEAYVDEEDAKGREKFLKSGGGSRHLDKQLRHYFALFPRRAV